MNTKERIFHSLLFEVIALVLMISALKIFTDVNLTSASGLAIGLSLIAMCWNYIYNLGFDHKFGNKRIGRSLKVRIFHGLGFELGLIFVTLPIIMWILKLSFWAAFMMDLGVIIFFLIYAIIYNWSYDIVRARVICA